MKRYTALDWLVFIIILCSLVVVGFGLLTPADGSPISFTSIHSQVVEVWGRGLYRYDTPITATGFTAADIVTLALAIPALVISFLLYRRGSLKGGLFFTGVLAYFLYNYTSMGFGAAYNNMFLAYILIFSASLFGLILALLSFDMEKLPSYVKPGLPRKGIGIFLIVSGAILSLIWLALTILPALIAGKTPPEAYYYTTFVTGIVDIGMVAPALILAGALLLRKAPSGYLLASTMLVFTCILGTNLILGGILQVAWQIITIQQAMAFTLPFVILSLVAAWFTIQLFKNVSEITE
jgi:hypothetical protein